MGGSFLVDAQPDFLGDRRARLLEQVPDQPDRPRHHAEPAAHLPVEAQLARERPDGSRSVQRDVFKLGHFLNEPAVFSVVAGLTSDFKEPHGSRVDGFMQWMAEAGDSLVVGDDFLRVIAPGRGFGQQLRAALGRADEHAPQPAQTGCDGRLHGFGRAEVREPRGERARREAMLDQRHHHRVEQLRLARLRRAAGELEEGHVAEVQLAEDLPRQVLAAHHDAVGARPGEIGTDRLARHQSALTPAVSMTFAHLAISASRNCAACSGLPPIGSMPIWPKRSLMPDSLVAFAVSAERRLTTSRGVPAGARNSTQVDDSIGGPPASVRVGTSGAPWMRFAENMASERIFPPRTCGISVLGTSTRTWISFAIKAVSAGAVPLYGTCTMSMPAVCFSSSVVRCAAAPMPEEPKLILPGLALA